MEITVHFNRLQAANRRLIRRPVCGKQTPPSSLVTADSCYRSHVESDHYCRLCRVPTTGTPGEVWNWKDELLTFVRLPQRGWRPPWVAQPTSGFYKHHQPFTTARAPLISAPHREALQHPPLEPLSTPSTTPVSLSSMFVLQV